MVVGTVGCCFYFMVLMVGVWGLRVVFFRFSVVVVGWLVGSMVCVVVLVWVWNVIVLICSNLGMGMWLFRFGCGNVVVLICSNGFEVSGGRSMSLLFWVCGRRVCWLWLWVWVLLVVSLCFAHSGGDYGLLHWCWWWIGASISTSILFIFLALMVDCGFLWIASGGGNVRCV